MELALEYGDASLLPGALDLAEAAALWHPSALVTIGPSYARVLLRALIACLADCLPSQRVHLMLAQLGLNNADARGEDSAAYANAAQRTHATPSSGGGMGSVARGVFAGISVLLQLRPALALPLVLPLLQLCVYVSVDLFNHPVSSSDPSFGKDQKTSRGPEDDGESDSLDWADEEAPVKAK